MNVVELRVAEAADVEAVAAIETAAFGRDAWSSASVAQELVAPQRHWVVAGDADELVGYAVTSTVGDVSDLQRVVVAPAARRQGLATRLLHEVVRDAAGRGAHRMLLEVSSTNQPALRCYDRLGFHRIDVRPGYYRDGSDAIVLELDLGEAT